MTSGSGHPGYAAALTSLIVFSNPGLQPIVRRLLQSEPTNARGFQTYQLKASCLHKDGKEIRALLLGSLGDQGLSLCPIASHGDADVAGIVVEVQGMAVEMTKVDKVIGQMPLDTRIFRPSWSRLDDFGIAPV